MYHTSKRILARSIRWGDTARENSQNSSKSVRENSKGPRRRNLFILNVLQNCKVFKIAGLPKIKWNLEILFSKRHFDDLCLPVHDPVLAGILNTKHQRVNPVIIFESEIIVKPTAETAPMFSAGFAAGHNKSIKWITFKGFSRNHWESCSFLLLGR